MLFNNVFLEFITRMKLSPTYVSDKFISFMNIKRYSENIFGYYNNGQQRC